MKAGASNVSVSIFKTIKQDFPVWGKCLDCRSHRTMSHFSGLCWVGRCPGRNHLTDVAHPRSPLCDSPLEQAVFFLFLLLLRNLEEARTVLEMEWCRGISICPSLNRVPGESRVPEDAYSSDKEWLWAETVWPQGVRKRMLLPYSSVQLELGV